MTRKQNSRTVTHEGQAFKRASGTRTNQFRMVGKRSYMGTLSRAGRRDKTDGANFDYWQRREPEKVEGCVSREDYQAHRCLKRLQAVEAAKEAGEYDRFVALGWCSRKDLAEKQAHSHRKVFTEVTILPVNLEVTSR